MATTNCNDGDEKRIFRFCHRSMATVFEIRLRHEQPYYAEQAALAAFQLLDRIEKELNRYDPHSDISRLNAVTPGQDIRLGHDAFACLQRAFDVHAATSGGFDITIGAIKDLFAQPHRWWKRWAIRYAARQQPIGMQHLHMAREYGTVMMDAPVTVDLSAIGKGYAVDRMLEQLREWEIPEAIVWGGASSVAVFGRAWPVILRHPLNSEKILARIELHHSALGASGLQKGEHIIDPRTKKPTHEVLATWVIAPDATTADAFSTAFMVCSPAETKAILTNHSDLAALIIYQQNGEEEIYRCRM